ncbi:Cyclin-dependent kinase F-1 [Dictyocoela muelleri]|nr:Cyclin-dependent kinase F-1 [Dictyocoela muelleri]
MSDSHEEGEIKLYDELKNIKQKIDYKILHKIGEGTFGEVFFGRYKDQKYALKRIPYNKDNNENKGIPLPVIREIKILKRLKNKNIIRLYEVQREKFCLFMVFEYMNSDLHRTIQRINLSLDEIKNVMKQILKGVDYLHKLGIVHRDMKSSNILIDEHTLDVKIADFGLARYLDDPNKSKESVRFENVLKNCNGYDNSEYEQCISNDKKYIINDITPDDTHNLLISSVEKNSYDGTKIISSKYQKNDNSEDSENKINKAARYTAGLVTLWYRPPEMLFGGEFYDEKIDIWGVGCIFGEILLGYPMFRGADEHDQLLKIINLCGTINERTLPGVSNHPDYKKYNLPQAPNRISYIFCNFDQIAVDLLSKLLFIDPQKRISASDALNHKFVGELKLKRRLSDSYKSKRVF